MKNKKISRREFIRASGLTGAGILLSACHPDLKPTVESVGNISETATSTPLILTNTLPVTMIPSASPTLDYCSTVSIAKVTKYDKEVIKAALEGMFTSMGGLNNIIKPGANIGIKVNLTGGTWWDTPDKPPANEYFVTHPVLVAAFAQILFDLGAGKITVMDGLGDPLIFNNWGYTQMAAESGITLLDLCQSAPYDGFRVYPVGEKALIYDSFYLHPALAEQDILISIAKMKCHTTTGITLSMKNLIGLAPTSLYRNRESDNNRSAFHGSAKFDERLPRVIVDLNRACPIHLAIVDGILTAEAGAGPWDANMRQVAPGILLAGTDVLAVDMVGTTIMGFDPTSSSGSSPFIGGENHLALAAEAGLGCFDINKIRIMGPSINEVIFPFVPAR